MGALISAHAHLGETDKAFQIAAGYAEWGVRPDSRFILCVLDVCMQSCTHAQLQWVSQVAEKHCINLQRVGHQLLRAHLHAVSRYHSSEPTNDSRMLLDAALALYSKAIQHQWQLTSSTYRWLLSLCASHNLVNDAIMVLGDMAKGGHEPGLKVLDDVMAAAHRLSEIDDDALALWKAGSNDCCA